MSYFFKFLFFIIISITHSVSLEPPKELYKKDLELGKGEVVKLIKGTRIWVHYKGWLFNKKNDTTNLCEAKGKLFDQSKDRSPFIFTLGIGSVIKGWEEGFEHMKIGGKRCLVIPPSYGYGNRSIAGVIPKNSTLIFEVELYNITEDSDYNIKEEEYIY